MLASSFGGGGGSPACPESFRIGVADVRQLIGGRCRRGGRVPVDGDREAGGPAPLLRRGSGGEAGGPNAAGREGEDPPGPDQRGGPPPAPPRGHSPPARSPPPPPLPP